MLYTNLPTEAEEKAHMEWTASLIAHKPKTWAIPRSGTIVNFDHENKIATFSNDTEKLAEYYFKRLGWSVKHD